MDDKHDNERKACPLVSAPEIPEHFAKTQDENEAGDGLPNEKNEYKNIPCLQKIHFLFSLLVICIKYN